MYVIVGGCVSPSVVRAECVYVIVGGCVSPSVVRVECVYVIVGGCESPSVVRAECVYVIVGGCVSPSVVRAECVYVIVGGCVSPSVVRAVSTADVNFQMYAVVTLVTSEQIVQQNVTVINTVIVSVQHGWTTASIATTTHGSV